VPTATTAGLTAARGPRAGELTRGAAAGRVPGTAGGAVVSVGEAAARGASLVAVGCEPAGLSAKLTATALHELRRRGVITDAEFQAKKSQLLDRM